MKTRPGWKSGTLQDLVFFQRGFDITKAEQNSGDIPVISSSGVNSYHSEAKAVGPGVVIGRKGSLGTVHYTDGPYWPHDTTLWSKKLNGNHARFVYYFLHTLGLERYDVGNSNPTLNRNHIHGLGIEIPEYQLQERIASILSAYDGLIENNQRRIQLLEQAVRLLYREWFVRFSFPGHEHVKTKDGVPEGWAVRRLSNLAIKISSGATPRGGAATYQSEGIALIRSQNVYDYRFEDGGLAYINDNQAEKLSAVTVEPLDILLNITGASVARCCMVPERHLPARVNQHVMIIRTDRNECSPHYILNTINSHQQKQRLLSIARAGGATREALTKDVVQNTPILVPSGHLLDRFEGVAGRLFEQCQLLDAQNSELARARDLLLPRLMNGEIIV
jgi:type I restriction enzyme, S subunit